MRSEFKPQDEADEGGGRKPVPVWNLRSALEMVRRRVYSSLGERGVVWRRRMPKGLGPPAEAVDEVEEAEDADVVVTTE